MSDEAMDGGMPTRKRGGKKFIIVAAAVIVLLIAAGAGLYFSGMAAKLLGKEEEKTAKTEAPPPPPPPKVPVFYDDLPDMLVNLNTGSKKSNFLKLHIAFQVASEEDKAKIKAVQSRVVDIFQGYLREIRVEDLKGSAGYFRLREELLMRVNAAVAPVKVEDVLFTEMLVQ